MCLICMGGVAESQYTLLMAVARMASKEVLSAHVPNGQATFLVAGCHQCLEGQCGPGVAELDFEF